MQPPTRAGGGVEAVWMAALSLALLVVVACATTRLFCATGGRIVGYWASSDGELFEIRRTTGGGYAATTASGAQGATVDGRYPVAVHGCRSVSIGFPDRDARGRIDLDRRRIVWGHHAPSWYKQGL